MMSELPMKLTRRWPELDPGRPMANLMVGWAHEDGTPCPEYLAADNGTRWWCTTHQQYLQVPGTEGAGTDAA